MVVGSATPGPAAEQLIVIDHKIGTGREATTGSTVSIVNAEDCPPGAFVCPEQTGQFDACGKCGACWSTLKNVAFIAH